MTEPTKTEREAGEDAKVSRMELWISGTLRFGVSASLILIVLGLVISFVRHSDRTEIMA